MSKLPCIIVCPYFFSLPIKTKRFNFLHLTIICNVTVYLWLGHEHPTWTIIKTSAVVKPPLTRIIISYRRTKLMVQAHALVLSIYWRSIGSVYTVRALSLKKLLVHNTFYEVYFLEILVIIIAKLLMHLWWRTCFKIRLKWKTFNFFKPIFKSGVI